MAEGFVYLLLNPSFPDQVKFGLTAGSPTDRAKKLWTTGVPTPFIVIFDVLVSDAAEVERRLHVRFEGYRVHRGREFFRIPVREAVRALQEEAEAFELGTLDLAARVDIFDDLSPKDRSYMKPDISQLEIVQTSEICFLEITRRLTSHSQDEIVERVDLSYIYESDNQTMFSASSPVRQNARRFVQENNSYDYLMMGMPLFNEEDAQRLADDYE